MFHAQGVLAVSEIPASRERVGGNARGSCSSTRIPDASQASIQRQLLPIQSPLSGNQGSRGNVKERLATPEHYLQFQFMPCIHLAYLHSCRMIRWPRLSVVPHYTLLGPGAQNGFPNADPRTAETEATLVDRIQHVRLSVAVFPNMLQGEHG